MIDLSVKQRYYPGAVRRTVFNSFTFIIMNDDMNTPVVDPTPTEPAPVEPSTETAPAEPATEPAAE